MKLRKWLALAVCLALVFSLCACRGGSGGGDDPAPTDTPSSSPDVTPTASSEVTPDPTQGPDTRQSVRVATHDVEFDRVFKACDRCCCLIDMFDCSVR